MVNYRYVTFETTVGWIGVAASEEGIYRTTLPQKSRELVELYLAGESQNASFLPKFFPHLIQKYNDYFAGKKVGFEDRLDLSNATDFERAVWGAARSIPYGETRSYSWIAAKIGNLQARRAVGQALGRNRLPILVPCHRVLTSNGRPGGFRGGLPMKIYLLKLESGSPLSYHPINKDN